MSELTPQETARRMREENLFLVDVREDYEWEAGRPAGAKHIELSTLGKNADQIPRDRPVAFICLAGMRSGQATQASAHRAATPTTSSAASTPGSNKASLPSPRTPG